MTTFLCFVCFNLSRFKCAKCEGIRYCSKECQRSDWKRHKDECNITTPQEGRASLELKKIHAESLKKMFCVQVYKAVHIILLADGIPSKVKYQIQIDPVSGTTSYEVFAKPIEYNFPAGTRRKVLRAEGEHDDPDEPWISVRIGDYHVQIPISFGNDNNMSMKLKKFRMRIRRRYTALLKDGYSSIEAFQAIFDENVHTS